MDPAVARRVSSQPSAELPLGHHLPSSKPMGRGLAAALLLLLAPALASGDPAAAAPPPDGACSALAIEDAQPGGRVGGRCVPNLTCAEACSQAYGESLAASPDQSPISEQACAGNQECLAARIPNIKAFQAEALDTLTYCLSRCWKHREPGACYQDTDCPARGPCQPGSCEHEKCTTQNVYDQTPCVEDGKAGLCLRGACVTPDAFVASCGETIAKLAGRHGDFERQVDKCRSTGECTSLRRRLKLYLDSNGRAVLDCVGAALDAGAQQRRQPADTRSKEQK